VRAAPRGSGYVVRERVTKGGNMNVLIIGRKLKLRDDE
jgi:hypothetical protein